MSLLSWIKDKSWAIETAYAARLKDEHPELRTIEEKAEQYDKLVELLEKQLTVIKLNLITSDNHPIAVEVQSKYGYQIKVVDEMFAELLEASEQLPKLKKEIATLANQYCRSIISRSHVNMSKAEALQLREEILELLKENDQRVNNE